MFTGRTRRQIRNKFKREEKLNHSQIEFCLKNKIPIDMEELEKVIGEVAIQNLNEFEENEQIQKNSNDEEDEEWFSL
jgi:hypothetical protein